MRIKSDPKAVTYVAFTYPYSYKELQSYLGRIEKRHSCYEKTHEEIKSQNANFIYLHRENLCYSLENRRIDLITITGNSGILGERESQLSNLFPESISNSGTNKVVEKNVKNAKNDVRPYRFHNKNLICETFFRYYLIKQLYIFYLVLIISKKLPETS